MAGQSASSLKLSMRDLPTFCYFFCGLLSHTGNSCLAREAGEILEPMYDELLNADKIESWLQQ